MILDRLEHADRYAALHPAFAQAFAFLQEQALAALPLGCHEIDGHRVVAVAARDTARPRDEAPLEAHRRHIDIQVTVAGTDHMGWRSRPQCRQPQGHYDAEKDVEFFADRPATWLAVDEGALAIFFPEDAHAPLVGRGELHKVVVKVAVD